MSEQGVKLLSDLIAERSITGNELSAAQTLFAFLQARSISSELDVFESTRANVYAWHITDPLKPLLILCSHLDVVAPGANEGWQSDPWTPAQRGRLYYGRGVCDAKGQLAAMTEAFVQLAANPGFHGNVCLAAVAGEEKGGIGAKRFAPILASRWIKSPAYCIIGEPTQGVPCIEHMKRYFDDALAVQKQKTENLPEAKGIAYCQALSAIEKEARRRKLDPEERLRLRESKSRPIAEEFFDWVTMLAPKILPESMLGKALTYAKNQRPRLLQFLQDGRVELDNNRSERSIKMFVMGRKAWLFCDTQNGARTSASLYGIIQTAIENRLKPLPYLQYVFETIRQDGMLMVEKALPWSSAIPDVCRMSEKEIARYEKKQQH